MAMPAGDSVDRLSFPVLCLARDTTATVAHTPAELQRCHALAFFKNRYFDDLIVLDARGEQFRVVHIEIVPALTGVRRWWIRAFNRRLTVRLRLERLTPASLATAKRQLRAWLRKAPGFWEASHELAEWERMIDAAPDMPRLVRLFS